MKTLLCKIRLPLMALFLLVAAWDGPAAITCAECSHNCMDEYYACLATRDIAYEICIQTTPPEGWEECNQAYDEKTEQCEQEEIDCENNQCVPRVHCNVDPPDPIPGDPLDPSPVPIHFGKKGSNTLSSQRDVAVKAPSAAGRPGSLTTEFHLSFRSYQEVGGTDFPIPAGYAHVTVRVGINSEPSDLLGARVRFGNDPTPRSHGRKEYLKSSSAVRPFEAGRLEVAGNVLRVEPLLVNPQPGDVITIKVTVSK
ncbi:MAG: hypothetical protein ACREAA_16515 [Candidatus Polarisedimenticolia bacterium]